MSWGEKRGRDRERENIREEKKRSPNLSLYRFKTKKKVVWKVTPLFASWLASPTTNIFFKTGLLNPSSTVLELGCGVSALVGLAVGPLVSRYVLSDQSYVARFVEQNLAQNRRAAPSKKSSSSRKGKTSSASGGGGIGGIGGKDDNNNTTFHPLDWELDRPDHTLASDMVIACDCIYNDALIPPLVQTCVDVCKLRRQSLGREEDEEGGPGSGIDGQSPPCVCVVAQQLRDPEIFEAWLREFCDAGFRAWRVPDTELPEGLNSSSGFVVHVGILRD